MAEAEEPGEPPALSALERAYRALFRWEDERMTPRIDALGEDFEERLRAAAPEADFATEANDLTAAFGAWFDGERESFLAEAVSYVDDDILRGLKEAGVDGQFGSILWEAIDEARDALRRRLWDVRERVSAERGG